VQEVADSDPIRVGHVIEELDDHRLDRPASNHNYRLADVVEAVARGRSIGPTRTAMLLLPVPHPRL
jgi:hypothetical protein